MVLSRSVALIVTLMATCAIRTQVPAEHILVATKLVGAPATVLIDVDPTTGVFTSLGRFPHDVLDPLALEVDPVQRDAILAVARGSSSRILRLSISGSCIASERILADVPGTVTDIAIAYAGDVYASVGGAQGGVFQVPRNGGPPILLATVPRASGINSLGLQVGEVWVAESGVGGALGMPVQMRSLDVTTGLTLAGPFSLTGIQLVVTGIAEVGAALPRHFLSDAAGAIWFSLIFGTPTPLPISPTMPPGGTRALEIKPNGVGIVLGGLQHPYLKSFMSWVNGPQVWQIVAGPFPGDPVDLALTASAGASVDFFGEACSPASSSLLISSGGGSPSLGNQSFTVLLSGIPQSAAILAFGASDQSYLGFPLPLPLLGGTCELLVAADALFLTVTDSVGSASWNIPVPNNPVLSGASFFGQWGQPQFGAITTIWVSNAIAAHVFP